jgi:hypothetical protein
MTQNQIIKSLYHGFAFLFLFYLAVVTKLTRFQKLALVFIGIFHVYDTYWFFTHTTDAPI